VGFVCWFGLVCLLVSVGRAAGCWLVWGGTWGQSRWAGLAGQQAAQASGAWQYGFLYSNKKSFS
jgi:hypothetical protein